LSLDPATAQRRRLEAVLPAWLDQVPLYRDALEPLGDAARRLTPSERLAQLPLITKADIRRGFPNNFLRAGTDLDGLLADEAVELEHTSGTSEARTPLILPRGWWAEQEQRALCLNPFVAGILDAHPRARRVTLTSPVCSSDIRYTGRPSHADRIVGDALFVNLTRHPFLWDEAELARMTRETVEWEPVFLDVDPVYGVLFGRYCEHAAIRFPSLRFVLASYEYVSRLHRRLIERAFGVPVLDLYGSTETGHLLMETALETLVPSRETAWLDILEPDAAGIGDLIVTTLTNDFMPLLRYRIGDLVSGEPRGPDTHYVVYGRARDAFHRPDGRRVTTRHVDGAFTGLDGFAHYQLAEEDHRRFSLRYLPDREPPTQDALRDLAVRLEALLDAPGRLQIEPADLILPESSGKFRLGRPRCRGGRPESVPLATESV
jgi:phenylacetate-CoA ligase